MPVRLDFPQTCTECKQRMQPGVEVNFERREGGGYTYAHLDCPPPIAKSTNRPQDRDPEDIFDFRDCSKCGMGFAIRRGMRYTLPFYCGSPLCATYARAKAA